MYLHAKIWSMIGKIVFFHYQLFIKHYWHKATTIKLLNENVNLFQNFRVAINFCDRAPHEVGNSSTTVQRLQSGAK
jgi:hypothetical protein